MFPVETVISIGRSPGHLDVAVVQSIRRSLAQDQAVSWFFYRAWQKSARPSETTLLDLNLGSHILVTPLHGDLPQEAQDARSPPLNRA